MLRERAVDPALEREVTEAITRLEAAWRAVMVSQGVEVKIMAFVALDDANGGGCYVHGCGCDECRDRLHAYLEDVIGQVIDRGATH
jgi:hypothetical protein